MKNKALTQKQKRLKKMIKPKIGAAKIHDYDYDEMEFELRCKHCGGRFDLTNGYDDKFCSEECFLNEE